MKLFLSHLPDLCSKQKDYMWKRHSVKGLWRPEIAQLKGLSACGIKAGARKLQTFFSTFPEKVEKKITASLCSAQSLTGILCCPLVHFRAWKKKNLVIPVTIHDVVYSLLCRFDGTSEPLKVLVWASVNSCEYICLSRRDYNR